MPHVKMQSRRHTITGERTQMTRLTTLIPLTAITVLAVVSIIIIPALYVFNNDVADSRLLKLSNIGQSYGILSAVLATLALTSIAVSIFYEAHQNRLQRIEVWRNTQSELIRFIIENPTDFRSCVFTLNEELSDEEYRQYLFTTLWLNFSYVGIQVGQISEKMFRNETCQDMFRGEQARRLWEIRKRAIHQACGPELGPFYSILDEEYEKATAIASAPPKTKDETPRNAM